MRTLRKPFHFWKKKSKKSQVSNYRLNQLVVLPSLIKPEINKKNQNELLKEVTIIFETIYYKRVW